MRAHLVVGRDKLRKYTHRVLQCCMRAFGIDEAPTADTSDIVLVSVDDPDDLPLVRRARRIAGKRPLVAGGFEAFGGEWLLAFADAVCVGEGYEYLEALGRSRHVEETFELPCVLTAEKQRVDPSYRIDEGLVPLVAVGPKYFWLLAGRGCPNRCSFCETSYTHPGWSARRGLVEWAIRYCEDRGARLKLISNESSELRRRTRVTSAQSVTVRQYLKDPERYRTTGVLHFGIEGWTEEQRLMLGKPISDDEIAELLHVLGEQKQQAGLFFISGLPGTYEAMMSFAARVPVDARAYPTVTMKVTRLDPSPHTPLWTYDLRQLERLTREQIDDFHAGLKARSIRFRLFPVRNDARQTHKSALRRCEPHEVGRLGADPGTTLSAEAHMDRLDRAGLSHLLTYDGRPLASSQVVTPHRQLRDRRANRLGMTPVTYKADSVSVNGRCEAVA